MNFITDLSLSKFRDIVYDIIVVFIDKFTKIIYYILTIKDLDIYNFIELFNYEVFQLYNTFKFIILD